MNLRRFLYPQILRRKVSESTGKVKSPVSQMHSFPEELDVFITSKTDGTFEAVNPEDNEKVMSNFFEIEEGQNEDDFFRPLIEFIFEHGVQEGWGSVTQVDSLDDPLFESIESFFQSYELLAKWVFCSADAYQQMAEQKLIVHPADDGLVAPTLPSRAAVKEFQKEHLHLGSLKQTNTPVLLAEGLGPYIVVAAPYTFVGMLSRTDNYMSIILHNAERGVVILRLEDYEYEFSTENNEEEQEEHHDGSPDELPEQEGSDAEAGE